MPVNFLTFSEFEPVRRAFAGRRSSWLDPREIATGCFAGRDASLETGLTVEIAPVAQTRSAKG